MRAAEQLPEVRLSYPRAGAFFCHLKQPIEPIGLLEPRYPFLSCFIFIDTLLYVIRFSLGPTPIAFLAPLDKFITLEE